MSVPQRPVGEDDLAAFVDGRLDPPRRAAVEAYLAAHPDAAARVRADAEAVATLRAALAGRAAEPIPARLRIASVAAEHRRRMRGRLRAAATAFLWIALGAGGGWLANEWGRSPGARPMMADAMAAHRTFSVEVAHPVEVKADQEAHLAQWLSRRLGRRLVVPDLAPEGLHLVGGRLLPAGRDVAAQLMYASDTGARLTLYVRCGDADLRTASEPRIVRDGELMSASWSEAGFRYALSGAVGQDRLLAVARAVAADTEKPRPSG